jgi:hypothetical protein
MIVLMAASSLILAALQDSIAAPTSAFRGCLRTASAKATSEKVSADTIEAYLRNACTVQLGTLRDVLVTFRLKNGMSKKAAPGDADMTINDYLGTSVDNYKFAAGQNEPKPAQPAAAPSPPAQPHN